MCSKLSPYQKKKSKYFRLNFGRGNEVAFLAFFNVRLILFGTVHRAASQLKIMPYVQSEKRLLPQRGMLGLLVMEREEIFDSLPMLNSQHSTDQGPENGAQHQSSYLFLLTCS